jgi:hypothetical protein
MQAARMQKATLATTAEAKSCADNVYATPEYVSLEKKLFLSTDPSAQVPLEYLTNQSKPTKAEIADLYKLHSDIQPCRKIALDGMSAVHPLIVATLVDSYSAGDRLWVDAASGKLTWGAFNGSMQVIKSEFRSKLTEAATRIGAQLQNQHQFELEQRQRAAAGCSSGHISSNSFIRISRLSTHLIGHTRSIAIIAEPQLNAHTEVRNIERSILTSAVLRVSSYKRRG